MLYDLFDLTGLSPDEIKGATVDALLTKKEKELKEKLGIVTQATERNEIEAQIKFLAQKRAEILDGKKLTSTFKALAKAKIEELKKRLTARILLEKQGRGGRELVVTNGRIKNLRNSREHGISLSIQDIENLYKDNGFQIIPIEPLKSMPIFPSNRENISKEIELLKTKVKKDRAINPKREDADFIEDLYDLAAYLSGDSENAKDYRTFSTLQLKKIFEVVQKKYTMYSSDTVEKIESNIAGQAVLFVFDSEAHRKGYDQYLLYLSPELIELFANMKGLFEVDLRDPNIAELCIKKIESIFGDRDVALAIYNSEAGLKNDPYIPDRAVFIVRCAHCQAVCEFTSLKEAQKINRCTNCGEKLYKKCQNGHYVLASLTKCPDCGYAFPDSEKFIKFMTRAEAALRLNDFINARLMLDQARMADTSEKIKTSELEKRINNAEKDYNEPITKLNELIKLLKFEEASRLIDVISVSKPNVNINVQRKKINDVINECKNLFNAAKDNVTKVNSCLDILKKCVDFKLALDFLAITPPAPCKILKITVNDEKTEVILSWEATGEREVKYTLVRKKGSLPPLNEKDGDCLMKDSKEFSFKDNKLEAGLIYSYSIFTTRFGRLSAPKSITTQILTKITSVQFNQKGKKLFISWSTPANCSGVSISYQTVGIEKTLSTNNSNSAVLDNVIFNQKYLFIFRANYMGLGNSGITRFEFIPTAEIHDFTISSRHVKDNIYEFSWSITENNVDVQILSGDDVLRHIRSEMRNCQINLSTNKYHIVRGRASSGGNMIYSTNIIKINTYKACEIDDSKTKITEKIVHDFGGGSSRQINISLALSENPPINLKSFAYFIRTDGTWPEEHEVNAQNSNVQFIDAREWKHNNSIDIKFNATNEEKYYLTLFAVYDVNGIEAISTPCRKVLSRPINAQVFWKIQNPLFGKRQLAIRIEANRPLARRPGFVLCTSSITGMPVLNFNDANARKILEIPSNIYTPSLEDIYESFEINTALRRGEDLYLFEKEAEQGETFTIRWDSGFSGTV